MSLVRINVETDKRGKVTLSGTAASRDAVDKAVAIARAVEGVSSVQNDVQLKASQ